ncbi:MAG: HAMP domain-containing histidine kinase [SAR324 cluster bacterium]|nr:HAMP domain-containing histidine kinase [SAR324 cluster bacterium]
MTEKIITTSTLALQVEASEKSLPDESDQIINDLEQQLAALRRQLSQHEASPKTQIHKIESSDNSPDQERQMVQLQIKREQIAKLQEQQVELQHRASLVSHITEKLESPFSTINNNLEQLINRVKDPEVAKALQQCKNLAFSMMKNVQSIHTQSKQLDQNLTPVKKRVEILPFFRALAKSLGERGKTVKLFASPHFAPASDLDQELFQNAIMVLLREFSRMSQEETIKIIIRQNHNQTYNIPHETLGVALVGDTDWQLPDDEEMQAFLKRAMTSSEEYGLDLLYAKKIIETHRGALAFYRENGKVVGFDISLPLTQNLDVP